MLAVKILVDAKNAQTGLNKASGSVSKFQQGLGKAALPAAAVGAAVLGLAKTAVQSASRMQQAVGGVDAVFKDSAGEVHAWAENAAESAGLSASAYSELATVIGAQLKNAGVPMDKLGSQTNDLITQGADLAAMFGGTTADAVSALSSALKGETDPIEKYGIAIKQADISARMAADGTDKLKGAAGKTAKTQALLAMVTEQSADAHGAFAREADSAATAQQKADAQWENAKASLGTILLPLVSETADALGSMAKFASQNSKAVQVMIGVVGGLSAAILIANAAFKIHSAVTAEAGFAQAAWSVITKTSAAVARGFRAAMLALNSSFLANPIVLIVVAIIALIAVIVIAYKKSATFRKIVDTAFRAVANIAKAVGRVIASVFKVVWRVLTVAARVYFSVVKAYFRVLSIVAKAVARALTAVFKAAWRAISAAGRAAFSAIKAALRAVGSFVRGIARGVQSVFRSAFSAVRSAGSAVASALRSAFATVAAPVRALANVIRTTLASAFRTLKSAASGIASALSRPFDLIASAVRSVIGAVQDLIGWLSRIHVPKIDLPGGKSGPATAGVAVGPTATGFGAGLRTGHAGTRAARPAAVTINVNGALDPDAVARQIETILRRRSNRVSGVRRHGFAGAVA